jgi:hypothetical protein
MESSFIGKNVKFLMLGIILVTFFASSCKKDDNNEPDNSAYKIRFEVNGSLVEFNLQGSLLAAFANSGSQYNAVFTGSDSKRNIGLQVFDSKEITENSYSGYTISGSSVVGTLMHYEDLDGTLYTQGSNNMDLRITITELTDKIVRGTFSGTLHASGKSSISITNGEFYVWRAN